MAPGIEHPQMTATLALFKGSVSAITPNLIDPRNKTPNQRALACGLGLGAARLNPRLMKRDTAIQQARALFLDMAMNGHMATGPAYGSEQGAPDPHAELWTAAMSTILREARLQVIADLQSSALGYWGDHVAMVREFWTPAGFRIACARAKNPAGMALVPNWTVDSRVYAEITGTPLPRQPVAQDTIDILRDSRSLWPEIQRRSSRANVKLAVPVLRWPRTGGGFIATLDHDVPMNDRLSWIVVDGAGAIMAASHTLDDFVRPATTPDLVFGGAATAAGGESQPQAPPAAESGPSGDPVSTSEPAADPAPVARPRRDHWWDMG